MSKTKDTANRINPADYDALTFWTGVRSEEGAGASQKCEMFTGPDRAQPAMAWLGVTTSHLSALSEFC